MPRSDVARTFGERFAEQLFTAGAGPLAGTRRVELRTAFRPRQRTHAGRGAAARCGSPGRASRVDECAPAGSRGKSLSTRCAHATRSWWKNRPPTRATEEGLPERRDEASPHASCLCRRCCSRPPRRRTKCGRAIWSCGRPRRIPTTSCSRYPRAAKSCGSRSTSACREGTQDVGAPRALFSGGAFVERRTIRRDGGFVGQSIAIEGLSATFTDVLVRVQDLAGTTHTDRLTPTKRVVRRSRPQPGAGEVAVTYLRLGIEHILGGVDHLLFVLALVILVREWRRVAITVTAFTIAHSITLAAATLGFVHVPARPVEATIALSIVLVAVEIVNARRGRPSLTARWPWLVAFAFGLLHGFGFAGALSEVGLPQHAIPLALLFFNLGVEVGQLAFVALVMALAWWVPRVMERLAPVGQDWTQARVDVAAAYVIGTLAAYWLIERTIEFWA